MFSVFRRCCLCAEFSGLNGASILETVVLRSRGLLKSEALLQLSSFSTEREDRFHNSVEVELAGLHPSLLITVLKASSVSS